MKPRHAVALVVALMLSSCAAQRGPTPQDVRQSEEQYLECLQTTDTSGCAYEKNVRDFWLDSFGMKPPELTTMLPPNLAWSH